MDFSSFQKQLKSFAEKKIRGKTSSWQRRPGEPLEAMPEGRNAIELHLPQRR